VAPRRCRVNGQRGTQHAVHSVVPGNGAHVRQRVLDTHPAGHHRIGRDAEDGHQ
jgi:hypothetical protein